MDNSGNRGFTLLELLIVVIMIGAIMAIFVKSAGSYYRQRTVQGAADRFVAAHGLARSAAMQYGTLAELHIDASNGRFRVEADTGAAGGARDTIGFAQEIGGVTMSTGGVSLLCFDARGLPSTRTTTLGQNCGGPAATVTFALPGYADTVTLTVLGKVLR